MMKKYNKNEEDIVQIKWESINSKRKDIAM